MSASAAPAATRPMGVVHIDAPQSVRLERLIDGEWDRVCSSPCDRALPLDGAYRVSGDGIRDSHSFYLNASDKITLVIEPTSSGARAGAVVLTVLGGVALLPVVGVSVLLAAGEIFGVILICPLAAAFETDKSKQAGEYGDCLGGIASTFAPAYASPVVWIPGVAGGLMLTGGIVLLASTPHTQVRQSSGTASLWPTESPAPPVVARLPAPVLYPILQARF